MADQVSRMASGREGVVSIFHEVAEELFGVDSRAASGLQDEQNKVDMEISIKFDFLCSFCAM